MICGHGGWRTIARVANVAAISPVVTPIRASRFLSIAGVHVVLPSCTVNTPLGHRIATQTRPRHRNHVGALVNLDRLTLFSHTAYPTEIPRRWVSIQPSRYAPGH